MWHAARQLRQSIWFIYVCYALLTLLVLFPLLRRGYILTLDMVFTPTIRMPDTVNNYYLFRACLHILTFLLPSDVIEKLLLFIILWGSGVGAYRLAHSLHPEPRAYRLFGDYSAGAFYMINPFTYDRFMAGQYEVLLGYAILPWFIASLLQFVSSPSRKHTVLVAMWAVISSMVSIHSIGLIAIVTLVTLILRLWQNHKDKPRAIKLLVHTGYASFLFILLSSYWLIPLLRGHGTTASILNTIGVKDEVAFATVGNSWIEKLGNIVRLQGFWAESRSMYQLPQSHVVAWGLLTVIIWILVIIGAITLWHVRERSIVIVFGVSALIAAVLAIGALNTWLTKYIPFFAGYREPEKFVSLIAIAYVVCIAQGITSVLRYCHQQGGTSFAAIAFTLLLSLPFIWTPTMYWGFNYQLKSVHYPSAWFTVNHMLDADKSNYKSLFLPWHLYMYFAFAGRNIANPAPAFFDKPVIVSDNPEFRGIGPSSPTPVKQQLDRLLPHASRTTTIGTKLAQLNIKYVILARDDDFRSYSFLDKQTDLKRIMTSNTLVLYRNEAWRQQ